MFSKKMIIVLLAIFSLSGCVSSSFYILSTAPQPAYTYASNHKIIGVEKVTVPEYLYKREIAVAKSPSQIVLLDGAVWAEDLDTGLTHRLISFLQKKFKQPNVYSYPWEVDKQLTNKVTVHITRFIAQGDYVYLDANWEVENMQTNKHKAQLFSTKVETKSDASSIVSSMDRAFGELEEQVALGIKHF